MCLFKVHNRKSTSEKHTGGLTCLGMLCEGPYCAPAAPLVGVQHELEQLHLVRTF